MITITISAITYQRLKRRRDSLGFDASDITKHPNGKVSFPINDVTHVRLLKLDPDPEHALIVLMSDMDRGFS